MRHRERAACRIRGRYPFGTISDHTPDRCRWLGRCTDGRASLARAGRVIPTGCVANHTRATVRRGRCCMTRAYAISMFVLMTGAPALAQPQPLAGKAILKNADGKVVGTVRVYPTIRGTAVTLNGTFTGLPPGTHAVHIHTVGKCEPKAFARAAIP